MGVGVALFVERAGAGLWEGARVSAGADGRIVVRIGSNPHGQGHETTFAQIAADYLGVEPDAVAVRHGDTAEVPSGMGTFASRSVTVGGSALVVALQDLLRRGSEIAATLLGVDPEEVEWTGSRYRGRDQADRDLTLSEVVRGGHDRGLPQVEGGVLKADGRFALPGPVFPFGAYAAHVEVDADSGEVSVVRLVGVDDAGRVINPLLAEGQVAGATIQGAAQALTEEVVHDETGQPLTTSFAEYGIPAAPDVPPIVTELQQTPSPLNPLGAKGIGEGGTIGAPAAIVNAVVDAVRDHGVRHIDFPLTPERVWRALRTPEEPRRA